VEIPGEGQVVLAVFAANRDPARYEQPDEMLLHRNGPPHLSFSDGPEAWLVRRIGQLERETVLRVLLSEFPPLRPMCPAAGVRFAPSPEFYVPSALPVRFAA
jgi:cytochrome P450